MDDFVARPLGTGRWRPLTGRTQTDARDYITPSPLTDHRPDRDDRDFVGQNAGVQAVRDPQVVWRSAYACTVDGDRHGDTGTPRRAGGFTVEFCDVAGHHLRR